MKIKIPTNRAITIRTFIAWQQCKTDIERMKVITGWSEKKILHLKPDTIDKAIELFQTSIDEPTGDFIRSFAVRRNFKVKRLGLIPNFESMTAAEYIDADEFLKMLDKKKWEYIPKLLAVLYRPIDLKIGDWYRLEKYDTDKVPYYVDYLQDMSLYHWNGVLAFFLDFALELLTASNHSLQQTTEKMLNQLVTPDLPPSDGSTS